MSYSTTQVFKQGNQWFYTSPRSFKRVKIYFQKLEIESDGFWQWDKDFCFHRFLN